MTGHENNSSSRYDYEDPLDERGARERLGEERLLFMLDRLYTKRDAELRKHISEQNQELKEELKQFIRSAFPEGDLESHKNAHAEMLQSSARWKTLKHEFYSKLITSGVYAAAAFAAIAVWEKFRAVIRGEA